MMNIMLSYLKKILRIIKNKQISKLNKINKLIIKNKYLYKHNK